MGRRRVGGKEEDRMAERRVGEWKKRGIERESAR